MPSSNLPQFMERQSQSNWCWAACGASVGNFYFGPGKYTQCQIANTCQRKTTCCLNPGGCNQYGLLGAALRAANSFHSAASGNASFTTLQEQIDVRRPVGTRVAWTRSGAHFMMVTGYNTNGQTITIQDPWYGTTTIAYSAYPANYQGGGRWTATYFTQKN